MPSGLFLLMDIIVLVVLAAAIFFCLRLTSALRVFSNQRNEFKLLITELNKNIGRAEHAISKIKSLTVEANSESQKKTESIERMIADLEVMSLSADKVANRLEDLLDKSKASLPPASKKKIRDLAEENIVPYSPSLYQTLERTNHAMSRDDGFPEDDDEMSFRIQDRESGFDPHAFDFLEDEDDREDFAGDDGPSMPALSSKAEQDLYQALQKNKKYRLN